MRSVNSGLFFREAQISDSSFLASLIEQLGHPIEIPTMRKNLQTYTLLDNQKAWVVEQIAVAVDENCPKTFFIFYKKQSPLY